VEIGLPAGVSAYQTAVGVMVAGSGIHAVAHAPVDALVMLSSALNRYSVRPVDSTRIDRSPLFATPTVAEAPLEVFGVAAVAAPLPQPVTITATSDITAALARKLMGLLPVMWLLGMQSRQWQRPAVLESRNA